VRKVKRSGKPKKRKLMLVNKKKRAKHSDPIYMTLAVRREQGLGT